MRTSMSLGERLLRSGGEAGHGHVDGGLRVHGDREAVLRRRARGARRRRRAAARRRGGCARARAAARRARGRRTPRRARASGQERRLDVQVGAEAAGRRLGERDARARRRDVVRRREDAVGRELDEEVHGRRGRRRDRATGTGPRRGRGRSRGTRSRPSRRASRRSGRRCRPASRRRAERRGRRPRGAHHPDGRRREDRDAVRLVVERDVPGDDGRLERAAREREAPHRRGELAEDLGPLGVAEVEAVRDRERPRAGAREVERGLGDRVGGAGLGSAAT